MATKKAPFDYGVRAAQMFDKYRKKSPDFRPGVKLDPSQVEDLRGKRSPRIEYKPRPKPQGTFRKKGMRPSDLGK